MTLLPTPPRSRTPPTSPPLRTPLATPSGRTTLRSQGISASTDSTALGTHRHRYTEATLEVEDDLGFSSPYVPRVPCKTMPVHKWHQSYKRKMRPVDMKMKMKMGYRRLSLEALSPYKKVHQHLHAPLEVLHLPTELFSTKTLQM